MMCGWSLRKVKQTLSAPTTHHDKIHLSSLETDLFVRRHSGRFLFYDLGRVRVKPALIQEEPVSPHRMREMELIELVKKAQAGDDQAIYDVCLRFTGLVKKYAFQSHVRPIADEAQSQGWLAVLEGIRQYDDRCGVHFAGYIESRVKYGIWNLFKRERCRWQKEAQLDGGGAEDGLAMLDQLAAGADVAGEVEFQWLSQELMTAVATLPKKQRLVIVRTVLGEEKLTTLAVELGITPQAVYNLRQRGLIRLKTLCVGMYSDNKE